MCIFKQKIIMEKSKKGLADAQEGEFILNESGTTVSTDAVEGIDIPATDESAMKEKKDEKQENTALKKEE